MTNQDDINAIVERFFETWDASIPVIVQHGEFNPEPTGIWARLTIIPIDEEIQSIGINQRFVAHGLVFLQIMVPRTAQLADGRKIENDFKTAFRLWRSADQRIRFNTPSFASDEETKLTVLRTTFEYDADH